MAKKDILKEFRESGMLWFINTILHVFGWAIFISLGEDGEAAEMYPARTAYRGFESESNDRGYQRVSRFMLENAARLVAEAETKGD